MLRILSPVTMLCALLLALGVAPASAESAELSAVSAAAPQQAVPAVAAGPTPSAIVEQLHGALLGIMQKGDSEGFEGRYQALSPVILETFDLEFMGSKCVGRHWKKLTDEEKLRWQEKFQGLITANYAGNFKDFDGESFETLGEEEAARSTRIVYTKLNVPGGEDVIFNYRLMKTDGRWRIIDIYLKGTVSELALRRSEFSSILKRDGFEQLALVVDKKIDDLRNKGG